MMTKEEAIERASQKNGPVITLYFPRVSPVLWYERVSDAEWQRMLDTCHADANDENRP